MEVDSLVPCRLGHFNCQFLSLLDIFPPIEQPARLYERCPWNGSSECSFSPIQTHKSTKFQSGFVSMLPHMVMAVSVLSSGQIADYLRSSGKLETQTVRKLFNTLGFGMEAVFLGILAFVRDPALAIFCLVIAASGSGTSLAGSFSRALSNPFPDF